MSRLADSFGERAIRQSSEQSLIERGFVAKIEKEAVNFMGDDGGDATNL